MLPNWSFDADTVNSNVRARPHAADPRRAYGRLNVR